jgi:hypothetical protein
MLEEEGADEVEESSLGLYVEDEDVADGGDEPDG